MDLHSQTETHLKESVGCYLGLPCSDDIPDVKLPASEEAQYLLREKCFILQSELNKKEEVHKRCNAEATMNSFALKKFVEGNRKLAIECMSLLKQHSKWDRECSLCHKDREALMESGDKAHERAKEAEMRIHELEGKLRSLSQEVESNKVEWMVCEDYPCEETPPEEELLNSALSSIRDGSGSEAHAFLETNHGIPSCRRLLEKWNGLGPTTRNVVSLLAKISVLKRDLEHLQLNLVKAEKEVNALGDENMMLNEEKRMLVGQPCRDEHLFSSSPKLTQSAPTKNNKRKSTKLGR